MKRCWRKYDCALFLVSLLVEESVYKDPHMIPRLHTRVYKCTYRRVQVENEV